MNGLHLVGVPEYPLFVRVGGKVVGGGVVGRHIEEQVAVLRGRVLRTVGAWTPNKALGSRYVPT